MVPKHNFYSQITLNGYKNGNSFDICVTVKNRGDYFCFVRTNSVTFRQNCFMFVAYRFYKDTKKIFCFPGMLDCLMTMTKEKSDFYRNKCFLIRQIDDQARCFSLHRSYRIFQVQ